MIVLIVIIVLLTLLLITPVGADVSFIDGAFRLKVKAGILKFQIIPKHDKEKKPKKDKEKKRGKRPEQGDKKAEPATGQKKITFEDVVALLRIGLGALGRFKRCLSFDTVMLHVAVASDDPCGAIMQYGYVNAAIGALMPVFHRSFRVGDEDIGVCVDFSREQTRADLQVVATLQIWEILFIGICALYAFAKWYLPRRRRARQARKDSLKKGT